MCQWEGPEGKIIIKTPEEAAKNIEHCPECDAIALIPIAEKKGKTLEEVAKIFRQESGVVKAVDDPWVHRSAKMRCGTCMWFVAKEPPRIEVLFGVKPPKAKIGRCRRHAPAMSGYPVVYVNDWCGDHKLDEEKLA
jgi:hypothetical protein